MFCLYIWIIYKTNAISTNLTFSKTIGRQSAVRRWHSRGHFIMKCWNSRNGSVILILAAIFYTATIKYVSANNISFNRHYKTKHFVIAIITRVAETTINVAYSELTKIWKNENVLQTCTRDTFAHTPNYARSTIHSLVKVSDTFSENVLQTTARLWIPDSAVLCACRNVRVANVSCTFLIFTNPALF